MSAHEDEDADKFLDSLFKELFTKPQQTRAGRITKPRIVIGGKQPKVGVTPAEQERTDKTDENKTDQNKRDSKNRPDEVKQTGEEATASGFQGTSKYKEENKMASFSQDQFDSFLQRITQSLQAAAVNNQPAAPQPPPQPVSGMSSVLTEQAMPRFAGKKRLTDGPTFVQHQSFSEFLKDAEALMMTQQIVTDRGKIDFLAVLADKNQGDFSGTLQNYRSNPAFAGMTYDELVSQLKVVYATVEEQTFSDATTIFLRDALVKVTDRALVSQYLNTYHSSLESVIKFFMESNPVLKPTVTAAMSAAEVNTVLNTYTQNIIREIMLHIFWGSKLTTPVFKKAFETETVGATRSYSESIKKLHMAIAQTPSHTKCLVNEKGGSDRLTVDAFHAKCEEYDHEGEGGGGMETFYSSQFRGRSRPYKTGSRKSYSRGGRSRGPIRGFTSSFPKREGRSPYHPMGGNLSNATYGAKGESSSERPGTSHSSNLRYGPRRFYRGPDSPPHSSDQHSSTRHSQYNPADSVRKNAICYSCEGKGHFAMECPSDYRTQRSKQGGSGSSKTYYVDDDSFCVDNSTHTSTNRPTDDDCRTTNITPK